MSLFKDSIIYLASELFAKALPFLLLPYLAHKLGAADFGTLSYWQTLMALLVILIGIGQDGAIARYYYVYGHRNLPALIGTTCFYTIAITLPLLLVSWFSQSLLLFSVILSAASQVLLNIQLSLRQCRKQARAYGQLQIGAGLATTALTLLLLEATTGWLIEKRFIAIFIGNLLLCALCFSFDRAHFQFKIPKKRLRLNLRYLITLGLPLILHSLSLLAKGQLDRVMLYHFYPANQLGVYAAAYQIATAFPVLLQAVNKATVPYYFDALKAQRLQRHHVQRYTLIALFISPLPALIAALIPESLYLYLLGQDFHGIRYYTLMFLFGFGLNLPYLILVNYLFYQGQNGKISRNSIQAALAYLLILWLLLPCGIQWAPWAMILANLLIIPLLWREINRNEPKAT